MRICRNHKHLQSLQPRGETGKNNQLLLDGGDLAPSSICSGYRHLMRTEKNQWSSEIDVPKREIQPHFSDCDNIPNNEIWEKEWEVREKYKQVVFELHLNN